ncbi:MAG TPA: RNA polymerase sigma factor [Acidimicrobiales bacterium]|jgi:RNA polymerase sigma-70 factor (ECF subfamily)|nr:RNA polymerase sigma factor [Acidimicrobiales bacterium]
MRDREFEGLVRAHAGAVSAYARAVCGDRWLAEEAVQETFLRAWRYLDSFRGDGSFEGWLLRICRNCLTDLANRADRPEVALALEWHDQAQPPDLSAELELLLGSLSVVQREAVALCGLLGYSYDAAAVLLDVPVGTIRSRLSRARAGMAEALAWREESA